MKTVEVECGSCGKKFNKPCNEYNRSVKLGRDFFCSRSCSGKKFHGHLKKYKGKFITGLNSGNRRDEFSPFRSHLRRAKSRGYDCTVTVEYLKELWESQKGKCAYTNILLNPPKYKGKNDIIRTASLDRIDSSRGYVEGNVQFVSIAINYAKNYMSDAEMREFIQEIRAVT